MPKYLHDEIKPEAAIEALLEFQDSVAWKLVQDWVEAANVKAITEMGETPSMSTEEMHYRRGTIAGGRNIPHLLTVMLQYFENQAQFAKLDDKRKPR